MGRWLVALLAVILTGGYTPAQSQETAGLIAFVRTTGSSSALYTIEPDGTHLRKLADCDALCRDPVWSNNGQRIGMVDGSALVIVHGRSGERSVTGADLGTYDYNVRPDWTPDLASAVFAARVDMRSVVRIVDLTTGDQRTLETAGENASYPSWLGGTAAVIYAADGVIYRHDLAQDEAQPLTREGATYDNPVVAPGGHRVILRVLDDVSPRLALLDMETGEITTLAEGVFDTPVWSPDGERIAANRWRNGATSLVVILTADGQSVTVTAHATLRHRPAWSPDSQQLVYISADPDDPQYNALFVVVSDGGSDPQKIAERISRSGAPPDSPAWRPSS